ncbi:UDP-diphosphatase [candidate division KSB3 bacterium]|uniref:Undecaprenyl-diphosphatase n=1 Tax=candidate division KSB3 bacterium TaxID=2044937 RepID=A0A9D5JWL1_9BACT|nr:UDP-diphosphatase [candidate division KSB3 bacterium]MBD3325622.1 UDP-diphosphatase [candidate division KSB3 bacterium]
MREILLGLIQGLTEFLPVSSSGHLALVQYFYPGLDDSDLLLDILLHCGTLVVVVIYYRHDIAAILRATWAGVRGRAADEDQLSRKLLPLVVVGSIPTGIIGVACTAIIEASFASLPLIGLALCATGTLLFVANRADPARTRRHISYRQALIVGTVQGIAVLPGISRSGSTIGTGILVGIERRTAAKFSFLLSIPAILGAVLLEAKDLAGLTQTPHLIPYVLGTLVAFGSGYLAIAALIRVVVKQQLTGFAAYCWALGGLALIVGLVFVG